MLNLNSLKKFEKPQVYVNGEEGSYEYPRIVLYGDGSALIQVSFFPSNGGVMERITIGSFRTLQELQDILNE